MQTLEESKFSLTGNQTRGRSAESIESLPLDYQGTVKKKVISLPQEKDECKMNRQKAEKEIPQRPTAESAASSLAFRLCQCKCGVVVGLGPGESNLFPPGFEPGTFRV